MPTLGNYMINSVEPAIDPKNIMSFLIDWEVTMKCNLDCSYCKNDPFNGGRWTKAKHPPLNECLESIDFFYEYTDLYMQTKPRWARRAVLNVYGGESLFHPDILDILEQVRERHKKYDWPITITTTTNAVIGQRLFKQIIPLIDNFTISYHSEALPKQKELLKQNVLNIASIGKPHRIPLMMMPDPEKWNDALEMIEWCKENKIKYTPRQLDNESLKFMYSQEQLEWWNKEYGIVIDTGEEGLPISERGRGCCGGRRMCTNQNLKKLNKWVPRTNFENWHCSVNHHFLFIKQHDKTVWVNKDCKMNFNGKVEPIGNLLNAKSLIEETRNRLQSDELPLMQCAKKRCMCGMCAPKAEDKGVLLDIMKKYTKGSK